MMILILTEQDNQNTNYVVEWLDYNGERFERINEDDDLEKLILEISEGELADFVLKFKNHSDVVFTNIKSYWYSRGVISPYLSANEDIEQIRNYINNEFLALNDYIHILLDKKKSIGSFRKSNLNKLYCLEIAKNVGFFIPNTLITNSKTALFSFSKKGSIISKGIDSVLRFVNKNVSYFSYTNEVKKKHISSLREFFFYSLFQQKVAKKYELRVFYFDKKCFSMAIFSQNDNKTKIDFRNYNDDLPNRFVPYLLPINVQVMITNFMNILELNTGSIDLIVTPDNQYYFLEVNPDGQFGFVSDACNYYLENQIANFLTREII